MGKAVGRGRLAMCAAVRDGIPAPHQRSPLGDLRAAMFTARPSVGSLGLNNVERLGGAQNGDGHLRQIKQALAESFESFESAERARIKALYEKQRGLMNATALRPNVVASLAASRALVNLAGVGASAPGSDPAGARPLSGAQATPHEMSRPPVKSRLQRLRAFLAALRALGARP